MPDHLHRHPDRRRRRDPGADRRRDGRRQRRARLPHQLLAVQLPDPADVRRDPHDLRSSAWPSTTSSSPSSAASRAGAPDHHPSRRPPMTRPTPSPQRLPDGRRPPRGRRGAYPRTDPHASADVAHYQELARIAERGKLDSVFFADGLAAVRQRRHNALGELRAARPLLAAIAAVTERIGLIATAPRPTTSPFNLARQFASLDHISGGRAGWNIVTSAGADEAAQLRPRRRPRHTRRATQRAEEFLEVGAGAVGQLGGRRGRRRQGARRLRRPGEGARARPRGRALPGPRPAERRRAAPQGRPLLVQAGSSEDRQGRSPPGYAEAVFTAQRTPRGRPGVLPRPQGARPRAPAATPTT